MRDRPTTPDQPLNASGAEPRINLWRLPRLVSVASRQVTFPEPRIYFVGTERRETTQAVELRVETSEPLPARAVTPVLMIGETTIADYTTEGPTTYKFTAYQPDRLEPGAPIRWGWPGGPDSLPPTRFRFALGRRSPGSQTGAAAPPRVARAGETEEDLAEQISVDDVASEMNGLRCRFLSMYPATRADGSARTFSDGALLPIDDWNGTGTEATIAGFNVPKIILEPAPDIVSGIRRYEVALNAQRNAVAQNATELSHWVSRESEFTRNHASWERERTRLETLLHRRQATYSRMWVRQMIDRKSVV